MLGWRHVMAVTVLGCCRGSLGLSDKASGLLSKQWKVGMVVKAQVGSSEAVLPGAGHLRWYLHGFALVVVAMVFWPMVHGSFVWDDWPSFHDEPWLTQGDLWLNYAFKGFNSWKSYFRPLGVLVFTAEVRLFHSTPGPMHMVSLAMHLVDVLLVGLLAWQAAGGNGKPVTRALMASFAMALYGLHPLLIEPVSWVGCQFDLLATIPMLGGLLLDGKITNRYWRASAIFVLFFLAACAKESAVAFPLILVVWNWLFHKPEGATGFAAKLREQLRRDGLTLVAMLLAGLLYLGLRRTLMGGSLGQFSANGLPPFGWFQEACYTYMRYLYGMVWPMAGMSPVHPLDYSQFAHVFPVLVWHDAAALVIVAASVYFSLRWRSVLAGLVLLATVALLPVIHVIPIEFETSYYHERYAMTALAVVCAALPMLRPSGTWLEKRRDLLLLIAIPLMFLWFAFAIIGIRETIPHWANDVNLWSWAYERYPLNSQTRDNLTHAYISAGDREKAHALEAQLLASNLSCSNCMVQLARMNLDDGDTARAAGALDRLRQSPLLVKDRNLCGQYYLLTGRMLVMQGSRSDARELLKHAMQLLPGNKEAQSLLKAASSDD